MRASGNPEALANPMRDLIHSLDSGVRVTGVENLQEQVYESLHQDRLIAILSGGFSLLALVLASIGLYGLLSYDAMRRTREIGVRMALGAQRKDVLQLVVGQGISLAMAGTVTGIACALALTRFLRSLLFDIKPTDPATFAVVCVLLVSIALFACYVPARRAMRVDPIVALRHE